MNAWSRRLWIQHGRECRIQSPIQNPFHPQTVVCQPERHSGLVINPVELTSDAARCDIFAYFRRFGLEREVLVERFTKT